MSSDVIAHQPGGDEVVVSVEGLQKSYGALRAVDGISFSVRRGEIFGIVGPNGAGKTTTIECLEGLRRADGGEVRVLGLDPVGDGYALRARIGVQLQSAALPDRIKVWETLDLFASFCTRPLPTAPLLAQLGLAEKRDGYFSKLSGGQKQRLFIALALLNDPEVVFLDELTTGLDPQARHAIWELVRQIRGQGKTVLLTTHFMEEAERLCDRVAIVDHGKIVALDTPANLIRDHAGETRVVFAADDSFDLDWLRGLPAVSSVVRDGDHIVALGREDGLVVEVVNALGGRGFRFRDFRVEQPTLEEVFLALTGRALRDQ